MTAPTHRLVVIGGGVTGLSAAIAWARNLNTHDNPVLVLEKERRVGGCVASFRRKGYDFDTVQMIPDVSDILEYLGVEIELVRYEGSYARILLADPASDDIREIRIPSGVEEFEDALIERYPRQVRMLRDFFSHCRGMYHELYRLKVEPSFSQTLQTLITCPRIVRHSHQTFRQYFCSFGFTDPELREVFDVFAAFSGLPAERAACLITVAAMNASLVGAFRPKGRFRDFPLAMEQRLLELGGEVRTNTTVDKIIVQDGRVTGVRTAAGEIIPAEWVVTTVDPKVAMLQLVGEDVLAALDYRYLEKVREVRMSTSSMSINLGLDDSVDLKALGFEAGYSVLNTGGHTFEQLFAACDRGELPLDEHSFHCAVIAPSVWTGGRPAITIRVVPMGICDWAELRATDREAYRHKKEKVAEFYIELVERYMIPRLREKIVAKDISTPATFARYLGSPTGSIYDMAPVPDNFGRKRLKMRTPIGGLLQPKMSHGIWPCLQAGLQAADLMLDGRVMDGYSRFQS